MVGGLVKQEQVGLLEEEFAQCDAAALATGEDLHVGVRRRAAERVHSLLQLAVEVPSVGVVKLLLQGAHLGQQLVVVGVGVGHLLGDLVEAFQLGVHVAHTFADVANNVLVLVERWLLQEDPHGVTGREARLAVGGLLQTRHDLEDGGFTSTVGAHYADLGARVEGHGDVIEDDLVAVRLARLVHGVNELSHCNSVSHGTAHAAAGCSARLDIGNEARCRANHGLAYAARAPRTHKRAARECLPRRPTLTVM